MNLFDQISEDIKSAMLARDKVTLEALRGIKKNSSKQRQPKEAMENYRMTKLLPLSANY